MNVGGQTLSFSSFYFNKTIFGTSLEHTEVHTAVFMALDKEAQADLSKININPSSSVFLCIFYLCI